MKFTRYLALAGSLCAALAYAAPPSDAPHWSYHGDSGPAHWGELSSTNAACRDGKAQSPIDLHPASAMHKHGREFTIHYRPASFTAVNNGHTIQASAIDTSNVLDLRSNTYTLKQFHFHTPSEHEINGAHYPMELHLVHQDSHGSLTVLGVFIKEGKANAALARLFDHLPVEGASMPPVTIDPDALLPRERRALIYSGSLTTPPCTEQVNWIMLEQPIELSKAQIDVFRRLFPDDHRDVNPLNNREVDEE
ncbi:carbonic anhydrase [Paraburkholderia antibiotica]|uniref:Carbonic anhydrase n=1 Tax=Paraburkholderia antibiotica TaxID=2728839 RepID=A0A7X9ZXI3_9BURK|nr:carbonic anhydrase family protein [Paraburkholderia antibiotica]NML31866.1 carbonic anhydrase [Paraburkholderia antibiotica]